MYTDTTSPVTLYQPFDADKAKRLMRLITTITNQPVTVRYESDSDADGGYSQNYLISEPRGVLRDDLVTIPAHDDTGGSLALAEYVTAAIQFKDEIGLALTQLSGFLMVNRPFYAVDQLLADLATAPGPDRQLDRRIHECFSVTAPIAWQYTTSMDAAVSLFRAVLPEWTYMITDGGNRKIGKVFRPALNPHGAIDDGSSWATTYEAASHTEAMALVQAMTIAVIANP